jgi:hypothetical protein
MRPPELAVLGEAVASATVDPADFGIARAAAPRADLAGQLSTTQIALLSLLNPVSEFESPASIDWHALTEMAARLACLPRLAARRLEAISQVAREEIVEQWLECRHGAAARNLLLANEEQELLAGLAAGGVSAMPLKGVSLARILHDDPAARFAVDIDLAVHPRHMARAADILRARGYRVSLPAELLRHAAFLRSVAEKNAEVTAVRQQAGMEVLVELHWKLLPLSDDEVWKAPHDYEPAGIRTLAPELYFLYLCEHLAGHGWAGIRWLCDIADFVWLFAARMDAQRAVRLARAAGLRRRVGIALELLDAYFGLTWTALDELRDADARRSAARFLLRPLHGEAPASPAVLHRERLSVQDGPAQQLRYLCMLAQPTHAEWLRRSAGGRVQLRGAAAAWTWRALRLAGLNPRSHAENPGEAR